MILRACRKNGGPFAFNNKYFMGVIESLKIRGPTVEPKPLHITDNVRDSGQVFIFGWADSGELEDEKSAMQVATIYTYVRFLAETVAGLPLPLHRFRDSSENGKEKAKEHPRAGLGFNVLVGFSPIVMVKNTFGTTLR